MRKIQCFACRNSDIYSNPHNRFVYLYINSYVHIYMYTCLPLWYITYTMVCTHANRQVHTHTHSEALREIERARARERERERERLTDTQEEREYNSMVLTTSPLGLPPLSEAAWSGCRTTPVCPSPWIGECSASAVKKETEYTGTSPGPVTLCRGGVTLVWKDDYWHGAVSSSYLLKPSVPWRSDQGETQLIMLSHTSCYVWSGSGKMKLNKLWWCKLERRITGSQVLGMISCLRNQQQPHFPKLYYYMAIKWFICQMFPKLYYYMAIKWLICQMFPKLYYSMAIKWFICQVFPKLYHYMAVSWVICQEFCKIYHYMAVSWFVYPVFHRLQDNAVLTSLMPTSVSGVMVKVTGFGLAFSSSACDLYSMMNSHCFWRSLLSSDRFISTRIMYWNHTHHNGSILTCTEITHITMVQFSHVLKSHTCFGTSNPNKHVLLHLKGTLS